MANKKKALPRSTADQTRAAKARERAAVVRNATLERSGAHASGFTTFIREQGVVGLAVGLAIGTAAGDTVRKLVEGFVSPVVQFLIGSRAGLEANTWHIELWGRTTDFKWGAFVSSLIALLATALVIYWVIHILKFDKIDKKKD